MQFFDATICRTDYVVVVFVVVRKTIELSFYLTVGLRWMRLRVLRISFIDEANDFNHFD